MRMIYLGVILLFFPAFALTWLGNHRDVDTVATHHKRQVQIDAAIMVDLVSAGLQTGDALPSVLESIGQACRDKRLVVVARALKLGVEWNEAWNHVLPQYRVLYTSLRPAWSDGVDPLPLLDGATRTIRSRRETQAKEAVERLGVQLTLPLGLCQLPAFVLLGLVPLFLSGVAQL